KASYRETLTRYALKVRLYAVAGAGSICVRAYGHQDAAPVRSSCDSEAQVIGQASKGDPAQILFAISGDIGTCYKVALTSGGKTLQGYLPAKSLSGIESFE